MSLFEIFQMNKLNIPIFDKIKNSEIENSEIVNKFIDDIPLKNFILYHFCNDVCLNLCNQILKIIPYLTKTYIINNLNLNTFISKLYFEKINNLSIFNICKCIIISLDQDITEDLILAIKEFKCVMFTNFCGKMDFLPNNIDTVIIIGEGNNIIPFLNRNLKSLILLENMNTNNEIKYNLENLPESITNLCLCGIYDTHLSRHINVKNIFIFSNIYDHLVIEDIGNNVIYLKTNIDLTLRSTSLINFQYYGNNKKKNLFNINNLHIPKTEFMIIYEPITLDTFLQLPKNIITLYIDFTYEKIDIENFVQKPDFICPFTELKTLKFLNDSFIYDDCFYKTSNIEVLNISKSNFKYINPLGLSRCLKNIEIIDNLPTYDEDTDDEFYEETLNLKFPDVEPLENNINQLYPLKKGVYQLVLEKYTEKKKKQKLYKIAGNRYKTYNDIFKTYYCKMSFRINRKEFNKLDHLNKRHMYNRILRKKKLRLKIYTNIALKLLTKKVKITFDINVINKDEHFKIIDLFSN